VPSEQDVEVYEPPAISERIPIDASMGPPSP
jgi:hypothetical protein